MKGLGFGGGLVEAISPVRFETVGHPIEHVGVQAVLHPDQRGQQPACEGDQHRFRVEPV